MATEMVNIKLEKKFLGEIDTIVEKNNYQSRTEFIREALRQKITDDKLKDAYARLSGFRGKFKKEKQTTDEEIERTREEVFKELAARIK